MKINRTVNATRSIFFGIILKFYQILCPFFMRTLMIHYMGIQYIGLNSLFASVLQVLNLAELGVGAAMVYCMYKPISEDNKDYICALTRLYRLYYRVIGLVILIAGIIILPFIKYLVKGDVPNEINIYVIYIMNLAATVMTYWLFAYKNALLMAHQRNDIISKITIITSTIQYIIQAYSVIAVKSYYIYLAAVFAVQIFTNVLTAFVVNKMYPDYKPGGNLPKEDIKIINRKVKDVFTAKLGGVILNSSDSIVISSFLGITVLAIYNNYYYILTSVLSFITVIMTSLTAGLGNSFVVETDEYNYRLFNNLTFAIVWLAGFCSACFLALYQPFVKLWVGESLMLDFGVVVGLSIYNYIWQINTLFNTFKDAGGIWHEDRFRPLITAITNLFLNLLMVQFCGIYGVLLSTILSIVFVGMPWITHNLFSILFKRRAGMFVKKIILWTIIQIVNIGISFVLTHLVQGEGFFSIIIKGILIVVVYNVNNYIVFHKTEEFEFFKRVLKKLYGKI